MTHSKMPDADAPAVDPDWIRWDPLDPAKSTAIADLFIPFDYAGSPAIAAALHIKPRIFDGLSIGSCGGIAFGYEFRYGRLLQVPIMQIGLLPGSDPVGIAIELSANRIPHLLRTVDQLRASSAAVSASVPCDPNGEPLEGDAAAWAAYSDVVLHIFKRPVRRTGRDRTVASLASKIPGVSDQFTKNPVRMIDALIDGFYERILDDEGDQPESDPVVKALQLLVGSGLPGLSLIEGPRVAAMDLALRYGVHVATKGKPTFLIDCLNRDLDPSERLLSRHLGWPELSDPLHRYSDEQHAKHTGLSQLPIAFLVDDSGCAVSVMEHLARWSLAQLNLKPGCCAAYGDPARCPERLHDAGRCAVLRPLYGRLPDSTPGHHRLSLHGGARPAPCAA